MDFNNLVDALHGSLARLPSRGLLRAWDVPYALSMLAKASSVGTER